MSDPHAAGVNSGCKLPDIGSGDQILVLLMSSPHSLAAESSLHFPRHILLLVAEFVCTLEVNKEVGWGLSRGDAITSLVVGGKVTWPDTSHVNHGVESVS